MKRRIGERLLEHALVVADVEDLSAGVELVGDAKELTEELAELPPGQARKKVSEDSGEMQIWLADAQWHQGSLLLKVILETSTRGMETYDLIVRQVSSYESWYSVAHWLAQKLGIRMKIG